MEGLKVTASFLACCFLVTCLQAQEKKPWEVERLCGKLEHVEKIPNRRHPDNVSEKRNALRDVEIRLYERRENEPYCSTGNRIGTARTHRGGRFEFRGEPGAYWLVSSWNGRDYRLPVLYKLGKPSATVCSEQGIQLDLALIDTLYHYRGTAFLLHEFVVMPDHIHVILTPKTSLEKAVQFIKGGFSYRAKKELDSNLEVWPKGFSDHRIRDANDYRIHQIYVQQNPVRKHLCEQAPDYPYSSARPGCELDPAPQGLKPAPIGEPDTARLKGVPFQNDTSFGTPFQDNTASGSPVAAFVKSNAANTALEGAFQSKISSSTAKIAPMGAKQTA